MKHGAGVLLGKLSKKYEDIVGEKQCVHIYNGGWITWTLHLTRGTAEILSYTSVGSCADVGEHVQVKGSRCANEAQMYSSS